MDRDSQNCVNVPMSMRSLSEASVSMNADGTYCVVGAGVSGLLFADRIAKAGGKVIVVESGYVGFDPDVHSLNEIIDTNGYYSRAMTGRYRGLGGTSARWGGRMIPISRHESEARPSVHQPAWGLPLAGLDRYDREIEALFGLDEWPYEVNAHSGAHEIADLLRADPLVSLRWAKCPPFKRVNVGSLLRKMLKRTENIEVWLGATVTGFDFDRENGRLAAITARNFDGRTLRVRAEHFVIAAGTIETTRLLLLMDAAADNRIFERCNVLGRYFQDHLKVNIARISRADPDLSNRLFSYRFVDETRRDLHIELSEKAQAEDGVASAFGYVAPGLEGSPLATFKRLAQSIQRGKIDLREIWQATEHLPVVFKSARWRLLRNQLYLPPEIDLNLMICAEQLPAWQNRITLSDRKDRFDMPMTQLDWAPGERDEATFRSAARHFDAYWQRLGLDRVCPLIWTGAAGETIIDRAEACAHPSGSTRLGTDPETSVVRPDLRCHAIPNVAVASASVFPTAGSANPTMTIMKLALSLADSYRREAVVRFPLAESAGEETAPAAIPVAAFSGGSAALQPPGSAS